MSATALIESQGWQALSLKSVARSVGVTEPALYRHYKNRDDLLAEVAVRGTAGLMEHLAGAVDGIPDPFDSISAWAKAYVRYAAAHPGWFRLQFSRFGADELYRRYPDRAARLEGASKLIAVLHERWRDALPRGHDEVADLYRLVWANAHGLAGFVVERVFQLVHTDEERVAAADAAVDLLVDALRARAQG